MITIPDRRRHTSGHAAGQPEPKQLTRPRPYPALPAARPDLRVRCAIRHILKRAEICPESALCVKAIIPSQVVRYIVLHRKLPFIRICERDSGGQQTYGGWHRGSRLCGPTYGCSSGVWLPVWLPSDRKGAWVRTLTCARVGLEPTTYCLGGIPVVSPDAAARRGPMCRFAAARMAGRGLALLCACGRWLPVLAPLDLISNANVRMVRARSVALSAATTRTLESHIGPKPAN
jgi:hypothetical protein